MEKLEIPISIFYGTKDWMAAGIPPGSHLKNPLINQWILKDASHRMYLDKAKELADSMIEDLRLVKSLISMFSVQTKTKRIIERILTPPYLLY